MAFEALKAELDLLLTQMQNEPEDRHELYLQIVQKLNELKAFGMPLPENLVRLEKSLEAEFASEQAQAEHWQSDPSRRRRQSQNCQRQRLGARHQGTPPPCTPPACAHCRPRGRWSTASAYRPRR